jgi:hypothetical protein
MLAGRSAALRTSCDDSDDGESCSVVYDLKPAADIVRELVHDAEVALGNPAQLS